MFIVYHSNSLELFMRLVIDKMSNCRLSNPMQSELMLIDNKMIEKWIEIELSSYFGISANIIFMNIKSFMQKISDDILFADFKICDFSYDSMYWQFMNILPKLCIHKNCSIVQKYLVNDIKQRKCGQFSMRIANLFSKYLIYRLDWLETWRTNKVIDTLDTEHQMWQSEIWRMLLSLQRKHIQYVSDEFNPLERCICLLQNCFYDIDCNGLPSRIFVYALTSMPPIYWKILNLLSYKINIYAWIIDPGINNWNGCYYKNGLNFKQKAHFSYISNISQSLKLSDKQYNLSLVNLWGSFGRDTLFLLNQLQDLCCIKAFVIPRTNSILHMLQRDILEDRTLSDILNLTVNQYTSENIKINKEKHIIAYEDQSITIHSCHYVQREIEVLYDNLLCMLSNDPTLLPGDIMVMAPNISCYKSAIKNIFNNIFDRSLPFSISSNSEYTSPVISRIFQVLNIWNSRFTSEEILLFLSTSSILLKFDINMQEIELIRTWIIESGIRWGLDQNTMKIFDVPVTDQNTWYFGLRRMLLGYAMNSQDGLWKNVYSYDYVNEEYIGIISKLGKFFNVLKKWRDRLSCSYVLQKWIPCIQEIIDDFFDCANLNAEENKMLFLLKADWINILESGIRSGYSRKINVVVLRDQLKFKFKRNKTNCQFLPNVINFCDITSVCCIPCKVLCIIGMNADVFPRKTSACDFDLILKEKRLGDYNIYNKDYYTFLLACLLPKIRLYISFINNTAIRYNAVIENSSTLIDELLEYIARNFCLIKDKNLSIKDNLKNLRKHLFYQHSYTPFDFSNFIVNSKGQSYAKEWADVASATYIDTNSVVGWNSFKTSLPEKSSVFVIVLQDLYSFYQHPIRTWFQKRLGVYFNLNKYNELINDEPFSVRHMDRFLLNTKLVSCIIQKKSIEVLFQESYAAGILPYGSFGKIYWNSQYEQMNNLASQINMYYSNEIYKLDVDLMCNKIKLVGKLNIIQKNGLIRWKAAHINMRDCFLLWLEHLIYCSIGGSGDSRLFGVNTICHFPNIVRSVAKNLLSLLIDGYCLGMNMPLMLLYRSGGVWMDFIFDRKNNTVSSDRTQQKKACQQLIKAWQGVPGTCFAVGEYHDPYLRKLIPFHLDEDNIRVITNTAKQYFLSVMQYRM